MKNKKQRREKFKKRLKTLKIRIANQEIQLKKKQKIKIKMINKLLMKEEIKK